MMRVPFYSTEERKTAFIAEARGWLGTPFRENAAVKGPGGGVDCTRLAAAVNVACGACAAQAIPILPVEWVRHWHEHHAESRIAEFFEQPDVRARLRRIDPEEPRMIGDLVALRLRKCVHHLVLWCEAEVIHATSGAGVISHSSRDPELLRAIVTTYRIHE